MELASKEISVRNGEEILILPLGDIQYAGEGSSTALNSLKERIQWGVDQGAYFVGMGDYVDFASPSNRHKLAASGIYDTAHNVIAAASENLTRELFNRALKPSVNRWLGMLEGHHYYQYPAGHTTDMELCTLLKTQHLGTCAYVRLLFMDKSGGTRSGNVTLWVHHGVGSGRKAGSPLNTLNDLPIYWDADIYLIGHQSKRVAAPIHKILPVWRGRGGPHLQNRTIWLACTGSYSKAYMEGNRHGRVPRGDYVEQSMMNPAALGGIKIKVKAQWISDTGKHGERHWNPEIEIIL